MENSLIKFRASSVKHLMTEPQSKADKEAGSLSKSTITHLADIYVSRKYGRNNDVATKYTNKGLQVEEDSLTLFTEYMSEKLGKQQLYVKNEARLENEYITGLPDCIEKDAIYDIKSSYDIFTFHRSKFGDLNDLYYWQMQAYMALTGKEKAFLVYCLIDTPEQILNDEKRKLLWKMGVVSDEDKDYVNACFELDRLHKYSDIPLSDRVFIKMIERNENDILRIYDKVERARKYLKEHFNL